MLAGQPHADPHLVFLLLSNNYAVGIQRVHVACEAKFKVQNNALTKAGFRKN